MCCFARAASSFPPALTVANVGTSTTVAGTLDATTEPGTHRVELFANNEGNTSDASFTIRLNSKPAADVQIAISISDSTEGTIVGSTTLTFTPANATTSQTVQLIGVDDTIDDGDVTYAVVFGAATSTDAAYAGLKPPDLAVTNLDNDDPPTPTPTPTLTPTPVQTPTPTSQPTAPVVVTQCGPRPKVTTSTARETGGRLRTIVSVTNNLGFTNELRSVAWTSLSSAVVVADASGPVRPGQQIAFPPGTPSMTFSITRDGTAPSATVHFVVTDACGDWPTFVGGGPDAF